MLVRALGALATAVLTVGCSSSVRLAGGPVYAPVQSESPAYGGEALATAALGAGDLNSFLAVEATGRAHATKRSQVLGVGLGPAWFGSFGRGVLFVDGAPMLGAERFDEKLLGLGTLRGGVGGGVVLHQSTTYRRWFMGEPMMHDDYTEERRKTALTLELVGNIDMPFTRDPQYSVGVLIGVARLKFSE